jgi:RHS repeat-associated protein
VLSDAGLTERVEYYADQSAAAPERTVRYSFDAVGRVTGYDDGEVSASYEHDARGNLTSTTLDYGPFSKTHGYSYYANGLKESYTSAEGVSYRYTYDDNNQIVAIDIPGEGQYTINAYRWSAPEQMTLPGGALRRLLYDDALRMVESQFEDPGGNLRQHAHYYYDALDNVTRVETAHGIYAYGYDAADRLASADNPDGLADEAYTYDGVDNRLTTLDSASEWQYNANNQLTASDDASYLYDANGAMTRRAAGGVITVYHYDLRQRLTRVETGAGVLIAEYRYDPQGRRLSKSVAGKTTYFLYNDEGLAAEYDASGTLLKSYHYAPDSMWMAHPLFMREGAATYYYHNDRLGTPLALYDQSGRLVWEARYSAYGEASVVLEAVVNNLRLAGQYHDAETGFHYNYRRYYDPGTGRYITSDPTGIQAGLNPYAYVGANPLFWVDPYGLEAMDWLWGRIYRATDGWSPSPTTVDVAAAFGDGISGGLTRSVRDWAGIDGGIDYCSQAYMWSYRVGIGFGFIAGGGAAWGALGARAVGLVTAGTRAAASLGASAIRALATGIRKLKPRLRRPPKRDIPCLGRNSFAAGTLVLTPDGLVAIETLEVGDLVIAKNEDTGEVAPRAVTATFADPHEDGLVLTLATAEGQAEPITTTSEHPFYVMGKGFLPAKQVEGGDRIVHIDPDTPATVVETDSTPLALVAYNIEVAEFHTYFVGKQRAWVHNRNCVRNRTPTKNRGPETPYPDATGRYHGNIPKSVPKEWVRGQIDDAIDGIARSINQRKREIRRLGNNSGLPGHSERLRREENFLKQLEKRRSEIIG